MVTGHVLVTIPVAARKAVVVAAPDLDEAHAPFDQSAGDEAKTAFRAQGEKFVSEMDLARRDEVEALKALAQSALERVELLEKRVAELEGNTPPEAKK